MVGWQLFQRTVHHQLRDTLQAKLDAATCNSALKGIISQAEFIEGKCVRLNDLSFTMDGPEQNPATRTQIEIYEALVHLPVSLAQLLSSQAKPTAIDVRRAKIRLFQNESGDWNLSRLLAQISNLKTPGCDRIPITFTDCSIELCNHSSPDQSLQLTDVMLEVLPIVHLGQPLIQIRGQFNGREVSGTSFTLFVDEQQRAWQANVVVPQLRLTPNILTLLPAQLRDDLSTWPQITGTLKGQGSATGGFELRDEPRFQFSGQLADFACDDPLLPLPIRQTQLEFSVDNETIEITNATGKLGAGNFQFDYQQSGLLQPEGWSIKGSLEKFDFSHHARFTPWLPEFCTQLCADYAPGGTANLQFDLSHNGTRLSRKIFGQLTDMSFSYIKFPYRADHCMGAVEWVDETCEFQIQSAPGQPDLEMKGLVKNPGPEGTYQIDVLVPEELPIDDKLLVALRAQPKLAKIVNDFNPIGRLGGACRFERSVARGPVSKSFDVRLKQCIVKHNCFDYPIHNVSGLVQARNDDYQFVELTGNNSSAQIVCDGSWNPQQGLDLRFLCKEVPLDDQLRLALKPDLREIWQGFRPRGTLDLIRVDLALPIGNQACEVRVDATMSKPQTGVEPNFISISPVWFPYEISRLTGQIKIGDGQIQLTDIAGQHGRSWLACHGDGHYANDSWSINLQDLLAGSLRVDDDLMAAVPRSLAPPLRQLSFDGLLNVQGTITLAGQRQPDNELVETEYRKEIDDTSNIVPTRNSLAWDLRFDMTQAKMKVGFPLENVFGSVQLTGQFDGNQVACRGELAIDSLTIHDAQITKVSGPIWLDGERSAAGIFANQKSNNSPAANFAPVPNPTDQPRSLTGTMHSGIVRFDALMNSDAEGEFYLQTTLADGDLKQFCREFAPQLSEVSGRSYAALRLTGNYLGVPSYRGDGTVQLRDGKIYQLPVMLSLLKILRIGETDRTAFDSSNVDFKIAGEDIELNRIEMLGEPISLLGNGKIDFNRNIDLNFYSVMGRNRINIPLLTEMYRASSQQVLWINVDGTLDKPQTHRHVLPQINDSLKQLFQPPEQHNMVKNWGNIPPNRWADSNPSGSPLRH